MEYLKVNNSASIFNSLTQSLDLKEYFNFIFKNYPKEVLVLDLYKIYQNISKKDWVENFLKDNNNEFSLQGRGLNYLDSIDAELLARQEGVKTLLKLSNKDNSLNFPADYLICDLLAGNGYVNLVANIILPVNKKPYFINSDISFFMFKESWKRNLFSVWQNANDLFWLKSNMIDAAIFAYGTHHIPQEERSQSLREAARILKPNGRLVMHDFEEGSQMSAWFQNVVNNFSISGHDYPHFYKEEMLTLFKNAGLKNIKLEYADDPFSIISNTENDALLGLAKYVTQMYGLVHLENKFEQTIELLDKYFGIQITKVREGIQAKIIRNCLICHGNK
jgi:SAM-dependent methyltransferase